MLDLINKLILIIDIPILAILGFWLFLMVIPSRKIPKRTKELPKISVIIATYNEEKNIGRCISKVKSGYPMDKLEIIVVDDSSNDRTREIAKSLGARVIKLDGVGKSNSLNAGINLATGDIIVFIDGDVFLDKEDLMKIVSEFESPKIGIVSGRVKVESRNILEIFQEIDYELVSQLADKHSSLSLPLPFVSGQILAFRKEVINDIGGFHDDVISEDTDAYIRALEKGWDVVSVNTKATTEGIPDIKDLVRQRTRWMLGGIQLFFKHREKAKDKRFLYPLISLFSWPVGTGLTLALSMYPFFYWFPHQLLDSIEYIVRWFTFIGVFLGWKDLPSWGFPITATLGITIGTVAMLLVFIALFRRRETRLSRWITALFFPIYGWVLMGICGILGILEFVVNPKKSFKSRPDSI